MPKLVIDGKELEVEDGMTIIQACKMADIEIPHFCYHEKLAIAGNCRMCLVEVEKSPKPVASCAMPVAEGMVVHTNTAKVKKAREGVMEFLLINHPLDCPICDQGGECDLQDQAFKYGKGYNNRFHENKRAVADKYMGPLVKTHMTRCIHCLRCVRFATDIAGVEEIGAIGRGEHMEITSYIENTITSELSGNIIDLCPVGALTSKPYEFKARNWELTKTPSVDVFDAMGSNIRVDSRSLEVMRILPDANDDINEEWLGDKSRFAYDGLKNQRLDRPFLRKNGKLERCSWEEALSAVKQVMTNTAPEAIGAIAGTQVELEAMSLLQKLLTSLGVKNIDANQFNYQFDRSARANYLFNTSFAKAEEADLCLLIGANPRKVAPVLNARIGQRQRSGNMLVAAIGVTADQSYKLLDLGDNIAVIEALLDGSHEFAAKIAAAKKPMVIIGDGVFERKDGLAITALIHELAAKYNFNKDNWNGVNILHNHASTVGALDIGFWASEKTLSAQEMVVSLGSKIKCLYLLGADELEITRTDDAFIIYQGHHGDRGAHVADVILPAAAYTEKDGIYINMEGRAQKGRRAVQPPGDAKEDWRIINELAKILEVKFDYPDIATLRSEMAKAYPALSNIGKIISSDLRTITTKAKLLNKPIQTKDFNYYMTDPISRASRTMARCTEALAKYKESHS